MVIRMIRLASVALAASLCLMPHAFAHAFLDRSVPAVGSTVAAPPASLRLRFTESVVPHFCTVQVLDAHGVPVAAGAPQPADGGRTLVVTLPRLGPGGYTVVWHVTAEDTHRTEGRFGFTVAP